MSEEQVEISEDHHWRVSGTEVSEIISINAEISLRNRCHISAFPGDISANMTEKVLESGVNAY